MTKADQKTIDTLCRRLVMVERMLRQASPRKATRGQYLRAIQMGMHGLTLPQGARTFARTFVSYRYPKWEPHFD